MSWGWQQDSVLIQEMEGVSFLMTASEEQVLTVGGTSLA